MDIRGLVKECILQVLKEELSEDPLYVEYVGERTGEEPFMLGGSKYQYVNAKYPNGKIDIGVYSFAGDMVYGYNAFRQMHNMKESLEDSGDVFKKEPTEYRTDTTSGAVWFCNFDPDKNKVPPGMTIYSYTAIHNPTKSKHYRFVGCHSEKDFEALMKKWNGTTDWKYIPGHMETEAFDPTSVGPNPSATEGLYDNNPYAVWNAKMRTMEGEMEPPIDDKTVIPSPHPDDQTTKSTLPSGGVEKYIKQKKGGTMSAVNTTSLANETMGRYAQEAGAGEFNKSFRELRNEHDPDGTKHDMTMQCVKCGTTESCRCSKPKRMFKGLCDKCAGN